MALKFKTSLALIFNTMKLVALKFETILALKFKTTVRWR